MGVMHPRAAGGRRAGIQGWMFRVGGRNRSCRLDGGAGVSVDRASNRTAAGKWVIHIPGSSSILPCGSRRKAPSELGFPLFRPGGNASMSLFDCYQPLPAMVSTPAAFNPASGIFVWHRGRTASFPNRPRTDPGVPFSSTGLLRSTRLRVGPQENETAGRSWTRSRTRIRGSGTLKWSSKSLKPCRVKLRR